MTEANALEWCLWGKAKRPDGEPGPEWHPLICHMLDVMNVADVLMDRLPLAARGILFESFGGEVIARPWLKLLVALHDLGKATPGFQRKWPGNLELLASVGLRIRVDEECHRHGVSGTALLTQILSNNVLLGDRALDEGPARILARAVASHHGEFARDEVVECCATGDLPPQLRAGRWAEAQAALAREALQIACGGLELARVRPKCESGFVLALAGLTSVADWLGSNATVFKYEPLPLELSLYQVKSQARAKAVLDEIGWYPTPHRDARTFEALFSFPPRSLQLQTSELVDKLTGPSIIIIESTMGDGKTEAALLVAERLAPRLGQAGFYVGLPTQATANQMLGRVQSFLEKTHPGQANIHLVHGDAALSDRYCELKLRAIYGDEKSRESHLGSEVSRVSAEVWFAQGKRSLLGTHAVGTVDQGLMGVLQIKHGFVRLFGLLGKTVILDEVHAYDAYTSELLDRLVAWLSVLGTTVVILSATLPKRRREQLVRAYGAELPVEESPYPRITGASKGAVALSVGTKPSRPTQCIKIRQREDNAMLTAHALAEVVADGGCAAWICNTVGRAQAAYLLVKNLKESGAIPNDTLLSLMHSRFLRKDRQSQESEAERRFGPKATERPSRAILVGTQVVEQSLDIDFDLMVTDLAPIDLVLQRTGRLHRHERRRPLAHREPELWIVMPDINNGLPNFDNVARVYEADVMFRTWWELKDAQQIVIPTELETWIERVYGTEGSTPTDAELSAQLELAVSKAQEKRRSDWSLAQGKLLFAPDIKRRDPFGDVYTDLKEDEDGELHASLRALTRLAEPTVDAICLWQTPLGLSLDSGGSQMIDVDVLPSLPTLKLLLQHSVKVDERRLKGFDALVLRPTAWREHAALRFKRVLMLGTEAQAAGVHLDSELGLVFGQAQTRTLPSFSRGTP
jgi:CRISPR-associated endonuclease/helicase Cas3